VDFCEYDNEQSG